MTAKLSFSEILTLARQIRDTMKDGLRRAAHYLRSLGIDIEVARWALLGAV